MCKICNGMSNEVLACACAHDMVGHTKEAQNLVWVIEKLILPPATNTYTVDEISNLIQHELNLRDNY